MTKKLNYVDVARILAAYERGDNIGELAKQCAVTEQAARLWRSYAGLDAVWIKRVKQLQHSDRMARKRLARKAEELKVATTIIKQYEPSPRTRSLVATSMRANFNVSRATANRILGLAVNAGESQAAARLDKALISAMKGYIAAHPRVGFQYLFGVLLKHRPGTRGRALQLYTKYFASRKRPPPSRGVRRHAPGKIMVVPGGINRTWSMDFMQDALTSGRRFWLLNVIDDFNREAIVLKVLRARSAKAVIEALDRHVLRGRIPRQIRTDRGGEFRSITYQAWTSKRGIERIYSRPRVPTDNVLVERFNRKVREEVLSQYDFRSLAEVQRTLEDWGLHYNYVRPNSRLNNMSPLQYAEYVAMRSEIAH